MAERTFREEPTSGNCSRAPDLHHDSGNRGRRAERRRVRARNFVERFDDRVLRAILSAAAITALFFGQRMAKDYAGAAVLVPYFLLTLVAMYLLG